MGPDATQRDTWWMPNIDERAWLAATFGTGQLQHMRQVFQPLGTGSADIESLLVGPSDRVAMGLGNLIGWFDNPRDRADYAVPILRRLLELLGQFALSWSGSIEHLHFAYQAVMETAYKLREDPYWLEVTVWAAQAQVALAPKAAAAMRHQYGHSNPLPRHVGYQRLAILADKAGDDPDVLRLCAEAQAGGWAGTWDKRAAKATKRLTR